MKIARGSLLAALFAIAAVASTAAAAEAGPEPSPGPTFEVTADLDGRFYPQKDEVYTEDFLRKGQWIRVECQRYGGWAYGSKLWDLVSARGETLYVPDRFIKTGTSGRSPEIRACDSHDEADSGYVNDPWD
jgi:hypothetical protein